MVDVTVSDDAINKSKLPSVTLKGIAHEIATNPNPTRPPATSAKKWQETARFEGSRYAANCRWVDGKIVITLARKAAQQKVRVARV